MPDVGLRWCIKLMVGMMRKLRQSLLRPVWLVFSLALLMVIFAGHPAPLIGDPLPREVRVGVLANNGEAACREDWQSTIDLLCRRIPSSDFRLVPLTFAQVRPNVAQRQVDLLLVNPAMLVELDLAQELQALATRNVGEPLRHTSFMGGTLFWRSDCATISRIADLRGKPIAAVSPDSFGGWLTVKRELLALTATSPEFFAGLRFVETHEAVVRSVLEGQTVAGIARAGTLEALAQKHLISLASFTVSTDNAVSATEFPFRVSTRLYPEWQLSALKHVDTTLAEKVAEVLIRAPLDSPEFLAGNYAGWTIPLSLSSVHACLRELGGGPYREGPRPGLRDLLRPYYPWIFAGLLLILLGGSGLILITVLHRRLQISENFLRTVIDAVPAPLMVLNPDFTVTHANAAARQGSRTPLNFGKTCCYEVSHHIQEPCDKNGEICPLRQVLETKLAVACEHEHRDAFGLPIWVELNAAPMFDDKGQVSQVVEWGRDITDRKMAQKQAHDFAVRMEHQNLALDAALQKAEEATLAKTAFLANMSHEIRTPMNGVIGATGLLAETPLTHEQQQYVEIIKSSGESLLTILNDILDLSKVEAGKMDLESVDFNLRATVEDVMDLMAFRAHEKKIELISFIEPDTPVALRGDPGRLRQVLLNLVSNGIKFTAAGEVTLKVSCRNQDAGEALVQFEVSDTGIGIAEDKYQFLFQPFSQVDASNTRKYGGTGLGLAIVHRLIALMEGTVGFESIAGKGSRFWFAVPLRRQPGIQDDLIGDVQLCGRHFLVVDDNPMNRFLLTSYLHRWECTCEESGSGLTALDMIRTAHQEKKTYHACIIDMQMPEMDGEELGQRIRSEFGADGPRLIMLSSVGGQAQADRVRGSGFAAFLTKPIKQKQLLEILRAVFALVIPSPVPVRPALQVVEEWKKFCRILVVEDNVTNQRVALAILKKIGYRAEVACNGIAALKLLKEQEFDLILMDCQMPEMDGWETTRHIRGRLSPVRNPDIPIIAMTAGVLQEDREKCLAAGMNEYISKPVQPRELAETLEQWIRRGHPKGAARSADDRDATN
jgi:PAS domain S-box-containing protein